MSELARYLHHPALCMVAIHTGYYVASMAYVDLARYQWLARLKKPTIQLLAFKYM